MLPDKWWEWAEREWTEVKRIPFTLIVSVVLAAGLSSYATSCFYAERMQTFSLQMEGLERDLEKLQAPARTRDRQVTQVNWEGLSSSLATLLDTGSQAHLTFVSGRRPVAERIKAAFDLAGWGTSMVPTAYDEYPQGGFGQYFSGVEVAGHNRVLVEAVAGHLRDVGLTKVRTTIDSSVSRSHPDWSRLQHRVQIIVGHDDDASR